MLKKSVVENDITRFVVLAPIEELGITQKD